MRFAFTALALFVFGAAASAAECPGGQCPVSTVFGFTLPVATRSQTVPVLSPGPSARVERHGIVARVRERREMRMVFACR